MNHFLDTAIPFSNTRKIYTKKSTSSLATFIIDTCPLSINQYFLKIHYFSFLSLLYISKK